MRNIRFKGRNYLLAGSLKHGGPICTPYRYAHGICSNAHLYANGDIRKFGKLIGTREDIEDLGPAIAPEVSDEAWDHVLKHASWGVNPTDDDQSEEQDS